MSEEFWYGFLLSEEFWYGFLFCLELLAVSLLVYAIVDFRKRVK